MNKLNIGELNACDDLTDSESEQTESEEGEPLIV